MSLSRLSGLPLLLGNATALAHPAGVPVPAHLLDGGMDAAMPGPARQVMARYCDEDRARYLGTLFRLQSAADQYPQTVASIQAPHELRDDASGQPPRFLQHEIYLRAKQRQAGSHLPYPYA
ncbi:hypothetical protein CQ393_15970 [Stenotrophomonas sp. MYb238]|uniref:hypothetical protein n=1 Tax=Stenotrophomonas sp. MYb238 TaxID=2040281 RepID=UPI0012921A1E|nr:hypothetical protein [Stenotrophomonas sp. MYb238]MQP77377.1 hypothetical protein [Stenotrophomonas sp. MYb238]